MSKVLDFLCQHDAITAQQHGFLSRKFTVSNLFDAKNDWTLSVDNGLGFVSLIILTVQTHLIALAAIRLL